jgi:hypothetical protein
MTSLAVNMTSFFWKTRIIWRKPQVHSVETPIFLDTCVELGICLVAQHRVDQAAALFRDTYATQKKVLGFVSPLVPAQHPALFHPTSTCYSLQKSTVVNGATLAPLGNRVARAFRSAGSLCAARV